MEKFPRGVRCSGQGWIRGAFITLKKLYGYLKQFFDTLRLTKE